MVSCDRTVISKDEQRRGNALENVRRPWSGDRLYLGRGLRGYHRPLAGSDKVQSKFDATRVLN